MNQPARRKLIQIGQIITLNPSITSLSKQQFGKKKKPFIEIVGSIENNVDGQFKDLRAALIGSRELRFVETHKQFKLFKTEWVLKDARQRIRVYLRISELQTEEQ